MFFLATADAEGRPTCSYKGGDPGFVRVLDERTLAFPSYDGNGMFLSAGNMLANPAVGILFLDLERGHRMRVEGTASIDPSDPLLDHYREAQLVVRVATRGGLPELSALRSPVHARAPLPLRPARRLPDARPGVEAVGLGPRRAPRGRPGPRPGPA